MQPRINSLYDLHLADAREITRRVPSATVDVVITSPPYADLKDYGCKGQIGFGQTFEEYLDDMTKVMSGCFYVARQTASLWIVVDTFRKNGDLVPLPFHLAEVARSVGWRLKDIVIWDKVKTLPWSRIGQMRNVYEYIMFFAKSERFKYYGDRIREVDGLRPWWMRYPERYNPRGRVPRNIWQFMIPVQGSWGRTNIRHFNPLPLGLLERIILLTTDRNDVVMDPFAGSGSVLAQANAMGRRFIGFELNPRYVKMFKRLVLPEVTERWEERSEQIARAAGQRVSLRETITKLRIIKFPKQLIRAWSKSARVRRRLNIHSVFVRAVNGMPGNDLNVYTLVHVEVYIIVEAPERRSWLEGQLRDLAGKPPLSKYGIEPTIYVVPRREFLKICRRQSLFGGQLFVYAGGVVTHPCGKADLEWWKRIWRKPRDSRRNSRGNFPLIVSDIRVDALRSADKRKASRSSLSLAIV